MITTNLSINKCYYLLTYNFITRKNVYALSYLQPYIYRDNFFIIFAFVNFRPNSCNYPFLGSVRKNADFMK